MVFTIIFCFISIISILHFSAAVDTLPANQTLSDDGGATLVSASRTFVLGFFSPGTSRNRYLGIWFGNVPERTVVWVANNNDPVSDSSGVLKLTPMGDLIISSTNQANIGWRSNSSSLGIKNHVLHLLDNGNLAVKNGDSYVWQSFDYPGDTLLGLPTLILRKGSTVYYRSGTWDGSSFGQYSTSDLYKGDFKQTFIYNDENAYGSFQWLESSTISRLVVNHTGLLTLYIWNHHKNGWFNIGPIQSDHCDTYGTCGSNSLCNTNRMPLCECLDGFQPRSRFEWESLQWSSGCARSTPLNCSEPQGFRKIVDIKLPDS